MSATIQNLELFLYRLPMKSALKWGAVSAMSTAESLCHLALAQGDIDSARRWYVEARGWANSAEEPMIDDELMYAAARIALAEGDWDTARKTLRYEFESVKSLSDLRRQTALGAMWLFVNGASLDHDRWQAARDLLTSLHVQTRNKGGQDFQVFCTCSALSERGEEELAYTLAREYARRHRRERAPLPS